MTIPSSRAWRDTGVMVRAVRGLNILSFRTGVPRRNLYLLPRRRSSAYRLDRSLKLFIYFNLVAGDQLIGLVSHADHRLQFVEYLVRHALVARGSGMRC